MNRETALQLVHEWTPNQNLVKHMLAVEAEMRGIAVHLGEDPETWGLTGLLHDLDYEKLKDTPELHPSLVFDVLKEHGADPKMADAIKAHAWGWQKDAPEPVSKMDWALFTCDDLSGMIIACALVRPDKKLASVEVSSIKNKWKDKGFARGVHREHVELCEEKLGIKLDDYLGICLKAIQGISDELGL
jgi:uncharacterized protein